MAALLAACGCGGGSSPSSTPSSPSPAPSGISPCAVINAGNALTLDILNGTACSTASTSVVLVNLRDGSNQASGSCSGTVISSRAVLTAAHCLSGDTTFVRVYPGTGLEIPADSFQVYPPYRSGAPTAADVGVVITSQDIPRSPIPLLVSRAARVGEDAVIAGWGKDQFGTSTTLRAGLTTLSSVGSTLQTQFSANKSSVCQGDSGGPLLINEGGAWAVAGVTSAVTQSGSCTDGTNFYANVGDGGIRSFVLGMVPNAGQR